MRPAFGANDRAQPPPQIEPCHCPCPRRWKYDEYEKVISVSTLSKRHEAATDETRRPCREGASIRIAGVSTYRGTTPIQADRAWEPGSPVESLLRRGSSELLCVALDAGLA